MIRSALAVAVLALSGCASTAPHTIAAAALNGSAAVGVAAVQRAGGGCWATCTNGTVCNPATGFCEAEVAPVTACAPGTICPPSADQEIAKKRPGTAEPLGPLGPSIGISPATGTVPTLPPKTSIDAQ